MIFNSSYYHAMDRDYFSAPVADVLAEPKVEQPIMTESGEPFTTKLTPQQLGKPGNPMQHQLQALLANIREGVGKIEFNFPGVGKGTAQSPTPESYSKKEREEMRALVNMNKLKTSVHATFSRQGFSGLSERGFNDAAREDNLKELKKAIDFSADATKGGAVVFHTGEWNRPIYGAKWNEPTGEKRWIEVEEGGKKVKKQVAVHKFEGFPAEEQRATLYVADSRTGAFVDTISKDQYLFEPMFLKAGDQEAKSYGISEKNGEYFDKHGKPLKKDDWISEDGEKVGLYEKDLNKLFKRVPKWLPDGTNFEVDKVSWENIVERHDKIKKEYGEDIPPEVLFARIHLETQILQAKGSSLFHAREYDRLQVQKEKLEKAKKVWEELETKLTDKGEIWKYMQAQPEFGGILGSIIPPDMVSPMQAIEKELDNTKRTMRFIHESSASADVQARERAELLTRLKPVHDVGMERSADSIARAAIFAMEKTKQAGDNLDEPIYIAPENWHYTQFGSHPEEMIELVQKSRKAMEQQLQERYGFSEREAKEKAKTHIKATIDVGHLNMWRQHFQAKPGMSAEERDKEFNKWLVKETKQMVEKGVLGHIHLSDNLGYDDEHLTPGTGNVPIKDLIEELAKAGIKDFVVEPGSFNAATTLHETFANLGSPVYKLRPSPTFASMHRAQFGYHNPAFYIVGAYSPSNEWVLWSEVPME